MTMTLAKADVGDTGGPPWADPALARFGPSIPCSTSCGYSVVTYSK